MNPLLGKAVVVLAALALDLIVGDPPNRFHPVAWMGSGIGWAQRRAPKTGRAGPLCYGAALSLGGTLAAAATGKLLTVWLSWLPWPLRLLSEALLLKATLALRGLDRVAEVIHVALAKGDLVEARRLVAYHLVSRDTTSLSEAQVAAATIESVAENSSDSVLAPITFYVLGGLPAALAYRLVNTGDAMLGYRDAAREWLGKVPARLDDLANLVPSRLTAGLFVLAAWVGGEDAGGARRVWRRDAALTASPNAGHPMSAAAGALGVELEKVDHYRLGRGGRAPGAEEIQRARHLMRIACGLAALGLAVVGVGSHLWRRGDGDV